MLQMPLIQLIPNAQDKFVDAVQGPVNQAQGSAVQNQAQGPAVQNPAEGPTNQNQTQVPAGQIPVQGPAQIGQNIPVQPPPQPAPSQPAPAGIVVPTPQINLSKLDRKETQILR